MSSVNRAPRRESIKSIPSLGIASSNPDLDTKVKKKKKKGTKSERLRKREEKKFNELYAPKDTKVGLISSKVLEQFRNVSIGQQKQTPGCSSSAPRPLVSAALSDWPGLRAERSSSGRSRIDRSKLKLEFDFPDLGAGPSVSDRRSLDVKPSTSAEVKVEKPEINSYSSAAAAPPVPASEIFTHVPASSTPIETPKVPSTKASAKGRSKKPLVVSIADFLSAKKETDIFAEGTLKSKKSVQKRQNDRNFQTPRNALDSSAPTVVRRGKIRKPKEKKPTPLKRAILTSRALRKATFGLRFGPGQNMAIPVPDIAKPATFLKREEDTLQMQTVVKVETPESLLDNTDELEFGEVEPQSGGGVVSVKDELFFRKLIEESLNQPRIKVKEEPLMDLQSNPTDPVSVPVDILTQVKSQLHSRKFRTYCDMYVTKELHGHVIALLKVLHRIQDKLYHTDPIKYNMKRRYVIGLKNVTSYLALNKVHFIIIAPDLELNDVEGGLDEKVEDLIEIAKNKKIPYIFSGHRYILGRPVFIKTPVSAIGVLDYQGGEDLLHKVLEEAGILRAKYKEDFNQRVQALCKTEPISP